MDFIYLDESQMIEAGVCDMRKCNNTMEDMFRLLHRGDYRLGGEKNTEHGLRLFWPKESDIPDMPLSAPGRWFTVMPAYLGGKYHMVGVKCYGANQENVQKGLPRSILMMSLMDAETGAPLAYMSANLLSAMRTGGVSGICARYLAPKKARKIAIIGPGTMARYSLDSIMIECPDIKEISVLGRSRKNLDNFHEYCENKGFVYDRYIECSTVEEVCKDSDIILTANSQAERFEDYPCIASDCLKENVFIMILSALRMERSFINDESRCVCVADFAKAYESKRGIDAIPSTKEAMTTITFKDALYERLLEKKQVLEISDFIEDPEFVRDEKKVYVCASGGIPTEDVAWAYECYKNAKDNGIGTTLKLWDTSAL